MAVVYGHNDECEVTVNGALLWKFVYVHYEGRQAEQERRTSSMETHGAAQESLHGSQLQLSLNNESSTAYQIAPSKKRKQTAQTGQKTVRQAKSSQSVPLSTPTPFTTPTVPATPKAKPCRSKKQATSSEAKRNTPKPKPSKPKKQFATPEAKKNTRKPAATLAKAKATNSLRDYGETVPGDATLNDDLQVCTVAMIMIFI